MHKLLTILCLSALASSSWAQDIDAPGAAKPAPTSPEALGLPVMQCSPCECKMCVPEVSTTKTPRVYYECERKEYCLGRCPLCCWCKKGCKDCPCCPKCSKPRSRNVLIKKTATEETESCRCVLKTIVEPCADAPCPQP